MIVILKNMMGNVFINSKRHNSVRKLSFTYDEDNLISVYKEVRDAIDLGK